MLECINPITYYREYTYATKHSIPIEVLYALWQYRWKMIPYDLIGLFAVTLLLPLLLVAKIADGVSFVCNTIFDGGAGMMSSIRSKDEWALQDKLREIRKEWRTR